MVRLILEENGRRRAFKVKAGAEFAIGCADDATLQLESEGVAEQHATLQVEDGGKVVLRPKPGVMPPTVKGQAVSKATRVPLGVPIQIGGAKLYLEDPDAKPSGAAAAKTSAARPAAKKVAPVSRGPAAAPAARNSGPRVERTRPVAKIEKGMPGWLMGLLLLIGIGGGAALLLRNIGSDAVKGSSTPDQKAKMAYDSVMNDSKPNAKRLVEELRGATLSSSAQEYLNKTLAVLAEDEERHRAAARNDEGSRYLENQLKRFERDRLQGDPPKKKIRVFLLRANEFLEQWPDHPDRDWVDRQKRRFASAVNLGEKATWEEADYEIETLTWAWPTKFKQAYRVLRPYLTSPDAALARERQDALDALQTERFDDKIQQAKYEFEQKDDPGKAVEILRQIIVNFTKEDYVSQAANILISFRGIESWLQAYHDTKPQAFDQMMENAEVARFVREAGIAE